MTTQFTKDVIRFNMMYRLAANCTPAIPFVTSSEKGTARAQLVERLFEFKKIMSDEIGEVDEIMNKARAGEDKIDLLVDLADWLGDLQVFCASEMLKFGLPNEAVLGIIMESNFSKLQTDGTPLIVDGKLQKGPGYWKPEPKIKKILNLLIASKEWPDEEAS